MKVENSGKDNWLRTQTTNQKLKQSATTQDGNDMKAMPVSCMKKLEVMSQE